MTLVHVMEAPAEGEPLGFHERRCTEPDRGEERVYHVHPQIFLCGSIVCHGCGSLFARPGTMKKA